MEWKGVAMAAKKIFPPGEIERLLGRQVESPFGDDYDEVKLGIDFRILAGQIVMQFSDHVEWIRMTSGGARKLAARLTEKANELDRLGNASAPVVRAARPKRRTTKVRTPD
jgi:hypothetical protein